MQDPLPYELNALEPVLSGKLMDHHFNNHHKTYVANYNKAIEMIDEAKSKSDFAKVAKLAQMMRFNGGGHYNHTFFWQSLAPPKDGGG